MAEEARRGEKDGVAYLKKQLGGRGGSQGSGGINCEEPAKILLSGNLFQISGGFSPEQGRHP